MYLPQRSKVILGQYVMQLLYPGAGGVGTPVFNQQGGNVSQGFSLSMTAPVGTIYYTTNGTDPRIYGTDAISTNAIAYGSPVTLNSSVQIRARAFNGIAWSPLNEATFTVAQPLLPLRITEIMYQPVGGQTYQFLELRNFGTMALDLTGWSISGVSFTFPVGFTITPGAVIVIASGQNPAAFSTRYPGLNVAAWFSGNLAKSGERIAIKDALGRTVFAVNYFQYGWLADSSGRLFHRTQRSCRRSGRSGQLALERSHQWHTRNNSHSATPRYRSTQRSDGSEFNHVDQWRNHA